MTEKKEHNILRVLSINGEFIQYVKNPNEKQMHAAIIQNPNSIKHMLNVPDNLKLLAFKKNIKLINYCNCELVLQYVAVHHAELLIKYDHLSTDVQEKAVDVDVFNIKYIRNPDKNIVLKCVMVNPKTLEFIGIEYHTFKVYKWIVSNSIQNINLFKRIKLASKIYNYNKENNIKTKIIFDHDFRFSKVLNPFGSSYAKPDFYFEFETVHIHVEYLPHEEQNLLRQYIILDNIEALVENPELLNKEVFDNIIDKL
jgi:hypothetical protein